MQEEVFQIREFSCSIRFQEVRKSYTASMEDGKVISRSLIRRAENTELSLGSLEAIVELRGLLDELEAEAIQSARTKGAAVEDIADVMGLTPQAIYHRLRNGGSGKRGRPKSADSAR